MLQEVFKKKALRPVQKRAHVDWLEQVFVITIRRAKIPELR
jgi:hypothetical protein